MVSRDGLIAVYIMASRRHGTLYIGVTGHLWRRVCQHREGLIQGFTKDYGCKRLVWFQSYDEMTFAIRREKSMKRWPRDWKINLIERTNPHWEDLFPYKHGVIPRRIPIPVILGLVPRTHDLRAARCASAPLFPVILAPVARTHDLRVTDLGSGAAASHPSSSPLWRGPMISESPTWAAAPPRPFLKLRRAWVLATRARMTMVGATMTSLGGEDDARGRRGDERSRR